jgi:hypothetical protein
VNGAKMRNAGLIALAFAVLSIREAAPQQTPPARPTWTPSADCQRLYALRAAHPHHGHIPWTRAESQEFDDLIARVGFDGCEREAERHTPPEPYRPEWGPLRTPTFFIKRVFPLPTPDASP